MDTPNEFSRRNVLATAGAVFTTSLFTGRVKGANDRVAVGYIGLGAMGSGNVGYGMQVPTVEVAALCDVYQPALERNEAAAKKKGFQPKLVKDFREMLADKSIDAVCISTPDHWHAYMTVEACKAGKDVYVEKPSCVYVEEGQKMVQAARKYNRIVQAGTMQRSGGYFLKAKELVKSGVLGDVTFLHAFQSGSTGKHRFGSPEDGPVPNDLDWDMWLGPAPKVAFNLNRWGVHDAAHPDFGSGFPDLPLLLGLRRRRHDRLGRAPDRSHAPVFRRSHAALHLGAGRQVLRRRQRGDARHHARHVPLSEVPDEL